MVSDRKGGDVRVKKNQGDTGKDPASGFYIAAAILAFILIVCVTVLAAHLIRQWNDREDPGVHFVPEDLPGQTAQESESMADETEDATEDETENETTETTQEQEMPSRPSGGRPSGSTGQSGNQRPATMVSLYQGKAEDNQRFDVSHMLPGDRIEKYYGIQVSHENTVMLYFSVSMMQHTKQLADVMQVQVIHLDTGKELYAGSVSALAGKELTVPLEKKDNDQSRAYYEINVSFPAESGNEYQDALLELDFHWYVKEQSSLTPPQTGDTNEIYWLMVSGVAAIAMICFAWFIRRREAVTHGTERGKRHIGMILVLVLISGGALTVTAAVVHRTVVTIEDSFFQTGTVEINLNDGEPVIRKLPVEPGMTVEKEFFIKNEGMADAYYRIYMEQVHGELAEIMEVTIYHGDQALVHGTAENLTRDQAKWTASILQAQETRTLRIRFHIPEWIGNDVQGKDLQFVLTADGIQARNYSP